VKEQLLAVLLVKLSPEAFPISSENGSRVHADAMEGIVLLLVLVTQTWAHQRRIKGGGRVTSS
jgi:hypothetical protein